MGYIVTCQDKEIWSPSLTVGSLYFEQISSLKKIIGVDNGVTNPFDDELDINKEEFETFINSSFELLTESNNSALLVLSAGCLEVSLYIYFLITDGWLEVPFELRFLNEKAKAMATKI